ncbi:MAG: hypothetical protein AB7O67_16540 [Vicinamibacterales bacterium]
MAKYGSNTVQISIDDSGGTARDLSAHILSINGVMLEAVMEESHGYNKAWAEALATGLKRMEPVEVEGLYDDGTNGPHAVLGTLASGPESATRTITFTWGGGYATAVEVHISKYGRVPPRGGITRYRATLTPTGTVTETTP